MTTPDFHAALKAEPETAAEALAARLLIERLAQLRNQGFLGMRALANQAAVWLRENPPGQPVAVEPRGCPTPGACSCVGPTPPAPRPRGDWFTVAMMAQDMRSRGLAEQVAGEELLKLANSNRSQPARPATPPAPEPGEVGELVAYLRRHSSHPEARRAATLLQQQEAELAALRVAPGPTFQDAIKLAEGCHDYSGGHGGAEGEAWHGAIDTVAAVLKRAAIRPWDNQLKAVYGVGVEAGAGELAVPEPVSERLRIVKAGIRAGYNIGHHHAVVGHQGDPDEVADDFAQETLDDIGLPPAPQCLMARMADELDRLQPLPTFPPITSHPLATEARELLQGTPAIPLPAPQAGEVEA